MKIYVLSLGAGLLVGVIYSLMDVRSPAPPAIALIGLLGILLGEQVLPIARCVMSGQSVAEFMKTGCAEHVLGSLPHNKQGEP